MLRFKLIYNLEAVAALLKKIIGLALVHFQKYWLLRGIVNWSDVACLLSRSVRETWTTVSVTIFLYFNLNKKDFTKYGANSEFFFGKKMYGKLQF